MLVNIILTLLVLLLALCCLVDLGGRQELERQDYETSKVLHHP